MLPPPSRRKPPHLLLHKEYPRCHASRQPPRSWSPVRAFTHRRHIVPRILVNEFLASSSLNSQFVSLLNVSALVYLFLSSTVWWVLNYAPGSSSVALTESSFFSWKFTFQRGYAKILRYVDNLPWWSCEVKSFELF